jgi:hypothetical protein
MTAQSLKVMASSQLFMPQLVMMAQSQKGVAFKEPAFYAATASCMMPQLAMTTQSLKVMAIKYCSQLFMLPQLAVDDAIAGNDSAEPEDCGY